jgi:hypothetical protein
MNIELQNESWAVNGRQFTTLAEARDYLDYLENYRKVPSTAPRARPFGAALRAFLARRLGVRPLAAREHRCGY